MTAGTPGRPAMLRRQVRLADGRPLLVRPASGDDAEALVDLRDAVAAEAAWVAATPGDRTPLEERLALAAVVMNGGLALVADLAGEVVGTLAVARPRAVFQAHLGELSVAVAARARGIGVGSLLLATAIDWARAVGVAKLWLSVFADNARAIALYRRTGFVDEGLQPDQVRVAGRSRDLLLMGLRLG